MKIFGLKIGGKKEKRLAGPVSGQSGWVRVFESFAGAWQKNVEVDKDLVLTYYAVFACMTLIASDISKMSVRMMRLIDKDRDIWRPEESESFSPVLRRPNGFQTRIQFFEHWILSKLGWGNTYVLKERDNRNVVIRMHILDPSRVEPLVADNGEVFYRLNTDALSGISDSVTVPATEIIHDRFNTIFHPLVGLPPILAAGLAASQGVNIQRDSSAFFQNRAVPAGILTAPGAISDEDAATLKTRWEENYGRHNRGRVAVLGDGLKFESLRATATDSQMIEQLRWTAEVVCSVFHVPPYKIGLGQLPSFNNVQALNTEYYSQALQILIGAIELLLHEGMNMPEDRRATFNTDDLLRMDTQSKVTSVKDSIASGVMAPNEGRAKFNLMPVEGGDTPYLQQQNWSLAALDRRDRQEAPPPPPATSDGDITAAYLASQRKIRDMQRAYEDAD